MILDEIVKYKRKKIREEKDEISLHGLFSQINSSKQERDFKVALKKEKALSIIAEIKRASPSKGIIKEEFRPVEIAKEYTKAGVEVISVLTEDKFFKGENKYLMQVKEVTTFPVLRKDFIIDDYQIYQSKVLGADAILLIVAILSKKQLSDFYSIASKLGIQCLVEVHDKVELHTALEIDVEIIGINNRNLKTFETSLQTTEELIKLIPQNKIVVSESGIRSRNHMEYLEKLGVHGVLIGESLMRAADIEEKIKQLRGKRFD